MAASATRLQLHEAIWFNQFNKCCQSVAMRQAVVANISCERNAICCRCWGAEKPGECPAGSMPAPTPVLAQRARHRCFSARRVAGVAPPRWAVAGLPPLTCYDLLGGHYRSRASPLARCTPLEVPGRHQQTVIVSRINSHQHQAAVPSRHMPIAVEPACRRFVAHFAHLPSGLPAGKEFEHCGLVGPWHEHCR